MSGASPESRKPADTPFKQQRLWAWQPILSPKWVISCFFFVAAAFIPIGALVIVASNDVKEVEVRYDNAEGIEGCTWMKKSASFNCLDLCKPNSNNSCMSTQECGMIGNLGASCPRKFDKTTNYSVGMLDNLKDCDPKCTASIKVVIPETMEPPIYMYYKLTSFYQNHRRYAKSRSDAQLSGSKSSGSEVEECPPVGKPGGMGGCEADLGASCSDVSIIECTKGATGTYINGDGRCFKAGKRMRTVDDYTYSPCGLVAWSQFNDSFKFSLTQSDVVCDGANPSGTQCTKEGIAWDADRNEKFQTPATGADVFTRDGLRSQMDDCINNNKECKAWVDNDNLPLLPYLYKGWYLFEPYHTVPQTTDEDFMVWMRTASLPTFRKLYRKIPNRALAKGTYTLDVDHRFDVSGFSGEKYVVFTTLTWIGGRNIFLGAVYIAIGALCVILALMFAVKHLFCRVSRQDAMQSYANMR